jgi:hypothetical protein
MIIQYFFDFDSGQQLKFAVDLEREFDFKQNVSTEVISAK